VKISVITAVKNGENFIKETVDSVLSQQGDFEVEYIIRDGCSTDNTLDILKNYGDKIIVISQKDGSPQEAINAGMNMATGDIGCWLNADDYLLPGALQKVVNVFREKSRYLWMYGRCRIIDKDNNEIRKPITWYKNIIGYFYSRNILLCENFINQPATFWRMDLWRNIGGNLDSKYKAAWDYELWLKMSAHSPAFHTRDYLACFRRFEGTISEDNFERQFKEELDISKECGTLIHYFIHKLSIKLRTKIYKLLSK